MVSLETPHLGDLRSPWLLTTYIHWEPILQDTLDSCFSVTSCEINGSWDSIMDEANDSQDISWV